MKNIYIQCQFIILLCTTVCSSQSNIHPPKAGNPLMINTQGTSEHANVHCGLQDRAGNLWFGTTGEGVYRYDGTSFINFTSNDGLGSNDIWCVYEDNTGNIWVGTGIGLSRYNADADVNTKPFSLIRLENTVSKSPFASEDPSTDNAVWSIMQDASGGFWVGTSNGVFRYRGVGLPTESSVFTPFLPDNNIIIESYLYLNHIQEMIEDKNGNIWFASWNREGVCRFDGRALTSMTPAGDPMVHDILEDKNGNIWFATRNHGACYYDGKDIINFLDIDIFKTSCVYSIAEDKNGTIWFGTEPGGLWSYHPSPGSLADPSAFTQFTTKEGLCNNAVFSVVVDKMGNIWCGTRGIGLCKFDGKTFTSFVEN